MTAVDDHYANHLGPVYAWMAGGVDAAIERGAAEVDALRLSADSAWAVDLGAGFGMHAIPLARRGFQVLAIDSCTALLDDLRAHSNGLPLRIVADDLLEFRKHAPQQVRVILCMGDTLTHLDSAAAVLHLITEAAAALQVGGQLIVSFRDYSTALTGPQRFIPVRSDDQRILTCFLEYSDRHVTVHDMLHERRDAQWTQQVSAYRKLRLSPEWVLDSLDAHGFTSRREAGLSGMVRVVAQRR